ncbi:DNA sulfur modification protein DndD [Insulibacter thermoxylanivorax]|uniref:DNA sulfur modification protein DndD n=1 Tax=Insulibacter thermoxylanivorax TaxID=2749268 RepID=UPI00190FEDE3|nr:DNA sulfur modification protein DndD [Insulibacter thermoxylanivorax]
MIQLKLTRLVLENYKVYYGKQEINLDVPDDSEPGHTKNLILIGGLNGRGKTTILNAIYYVLFGKQGMSEQDYKLTFSGAINDRYYEEGGRDCSVSLSFEDEHETVTVIVTWTFDHRKTLIGENRKVYVKNNSDGKTRETSISEQEYYDFINRRIPFEAAPFFIFDGEKIQELVTKQDDKLMKQSIQRIVSIEIYQELVNDLEKLQSSLERKLRQKQVNRKLSEILDEIEENKDRLERYRANLKKTEEEFEQLNKRFIEIDQKRRKKLAASTESNVQIQKRLAEYELRLEQVNKQLEDFAKGGLTKYLLAPLIKKMQQSLQEEKKFIDLQQQHRSQFAPFESFMSRLTSVRIEPPLTVEQMDQILTEGKKIWAELNRINTVELPHREIIHDISPRMREKLLSLPTSINHNIRELLDQKLQYERLIKEQKELLENAPDPIDTTEEDEQLKAIGALLGEKKSLMKRAQLGIRKYSHAIEDLRRKYTQIEKTTEEQSELQQQLRLVSNLRTVTEKFVEEVTSIKTQKIKFEFKHILERLVQKEQDFVEVDFDEEDFVIKIYNDRGAEVKLADRSAGEKQIIALAYIWALTKTAGLKLPFVIDTPLGRLDSLHRSHIVRYYFNLLSDQVIILSTDTEITKEYLKQVQNYLVRSYELVYDEKLQSTTIREGYFEF